MSIRVNVHADSSTLNTHVHEQSHGNFCVELALMQEEHRFGGGVDVFCTDAQAASILVALADSERVREALSFEERRRMEFYLRTLDEHEFEGSLQP
jgi:hypothetical protein